MEIWRKINIRFFPNRRTADVIKVEVDVSGEDIFDPVVAAEANSFPDHLVIMVNGIVGRYEFLISCSVYWILIYNFQFQFYFYEQTMFFLNSVIYVDLSEM